MKFAQGRTQDNSAAQTQVQAGVASAALLQSQLLQQQTKKVTAIKHSPQQLLQRKQLQGLVSQQISLDEEKPMQGKFAIVQQAALEEEEPLQGKFATVQQAALEEEEPLQGKFALIQQAALEEEEPLQGKFGPVAVAQREVEATAGNNTGMPEQLKSGIESLSGYAMDDVKVHYNSAKPAAMQAHAYAQGTDIHIAPGQEQHLPHEAWHVVQQKQGRVKATTQLKGEAINDDPGLEHEADVMGAKALQQHSANEREAANTHNTAGGETSQRYAAKVIHDTARKHYGDGWGALYGIQNDTELNNAVPNAVRGSGYIELDEYDAPDSEQVPGDRLFSKECFIAYKNANSPETTLIYHCGPSGKKFYHD